VPAQDAPAVTPMSIFDFWVWDLANAYSFLGLLHKLDSITEAMVERVEVMAQFLIDEMMAQLSDPATFDPEKLKFKPALSLESVASIRKGIFVTDDAVLYLLVPMVHVLGARFMCGAGRYTRGPQSPLIQHDQTNADNFYVMDSQLAALLEKIVADTEAHVRVRRASRVADAVKSLQNMVNVLRPRSRVRSRPVGKKVVFGTDSTLIAATHLPGHYVTTEVEGLMQSRRNITITRADSNDPAPLLEKGRVHDALSIVLRAIGAIEKTQKVDLFGLALPPQTLPDCAFYMLTRVATKLTGVPLPGNLWAVNTRIMRCYMVFLAFRELCEAKAVQEDVWDRAMAKFTRHAWVPPEVESAVAQLAISIPQHLCTIDATPPALWTTATDTF
jgi:hypothetical protein